MNNKNLKYNLYLGITLLFALMSVIIRTVLLISYFDRDIGYYSHGTVLPGIHTVILCASVIFAASFLLATRKDECEEKKFRNSGIFIFSSSLCAFMLIASLLLTFTKADTTLEKIAAFTAAPAALYFLSALIRSADTAKLRTLFGFFVPIWGTLNLAVIYFDSFVAINAPNKIIEQMAFICVMLFFLYELRIHLNKQKPKLYSFCGMCALVFAATAAFPGIVAASFGAIDANYLMYDVIFAAMFIYVLVTMLQSKKECGGK